MWSMAKKGGRSDAWIGLGFFLFCLEIEPVGVQVRSLCLEACVQAQGVCECKSCVS
jgi:hypothetical protein